MEKIKMFNEDNRDIKLCAICGTKINITFTEIDTENIDDRYNAAFIHGGIYGTLSAGFDSSHDGNIYGVVICDKCINNIKDKLIHIGNYMEDILFEDEE